MQFIPASSTLASTILVFWQHLFSFLVGIDVQLPQEHLEKYRRFGKTLDGQKKGGVDGVYKKVNVGKHWCYVYCYPINISCVMCRLPFPFILILINLKLKHVPCDISCLFEVFTCAQCAVENAC